MAKFNPVLFLIPIAGYCPFTSFNSDKAFVPLTSKSEYMVEDNTFEYLL